MFVNFSGTSKKCLGEIITDYHQAAKAKPSHGLLEEGRNQNATL